MKDIFGSMSEAKMVVGSRRSKYHLKALSSVYWITATTIKSTDEEVGKAGVCKVRLTCTRA